MAKKYNCEKNGIPYFRKTKTVGHRADGTAVKKEFYGDGEKDCDKQIEEYMDKIKNRLKCWYWKTNRWARNASMAIWCFIAF